MSAIWQHFVRVVPIAEEGLTCPRFGYIVSAILRHQETQRRAVTPPRHTRRPAQQRRQQERISPQPQTRCTFSIGRVRRDLDLTQQAMARRMGIARTTYNQLENGKTRSGSITMPLARLVAHFTGQTVAQVIAEYEREGAL